MKFTVLGSSGFIGRRLTAHLRELGEKVYCPDRNASYGAQSLGHIIYCIGLTADFRSYPAETVDAHVCKLLDIFRNADFTSFLYLSSTRVYSSSKTADEESPCIVNSHLPSDLYNLSKLTGEALCLAMPRPEIRVVRLSNVYGPDWNSENFLTSLIRDGVGKSKVTMRTSRASVKDYVSLDDVVKIIPQLSQHGKQRLYNIASGKNTSHGDLLDALQQITGCEVTWTEGSPTSSFPPIQTQRLKAEFPWQPKSVLADLRALVNAYRDTYDKN
jgi:nucleoside-diphosphate-sugar epimerase